MPIFKVLALCLLLFSCAQIEEVKVSGVDQLIESHIKKKDFSGAVLLVQKDGKIIHHKAYGIADDKGTPVTTDHYFDLASLTKVYATTMALMYLVSERQISLDQPVARYLPQFNRFDKRSITVRQLLNHTSGLDKWKPLYVHAKNKRQVLDFIGTWPVKYPIGQKREYSDLNFIVLGALIEKVTGLSLDLFLAQVLGMVGAQVVFNPDKKLPIVATSVGNLFEIKMIDEPDFGYFVPEHSYQFDNWRNYRIQGEANDGNAYYALRGVAGHAGLFGRAIDLNIMSNFLMQDKQDFIKRWVIDEFLGLDRYANGLGWAKEDDILKFENKSNAFGHYGFTGTTAINFPKTKSTLIFLCNRQFYGLQGKSYYEFRELTKEFIDYFDLK